jgi:cyclopropane-fatty-acyl-phospholipid synthase
MGIGLALAERGLVPLPGLRAGIRRLLADRLREESTAPDLDAFVTMLSKAPIALQPEKANEQHYEVPPGFFELTLGPHLKYSSAYWPDGVATLADAEAQMLALSSERAELRDGQDVLELGCGWGSLTLHMARTYPNSRIVAVSNSAPQREFILARAPANVDVVTADMNDFTIDRQFDRVVSIEMFEHMRNYRDLLGRVAGWLRPDGRLFVHVFCHRRYAYLFETEGDHNWMGKYFFTAGLMPSLDLLPRFDRDLEVEDQWAVHGTHYGRTAEAWRLNLETRRSAVMDVLRATYGRDAHRWYHRWRIFFLACEELFNYRGGDEWLVGHYRFRHTGG